MRTPGPWEAVRTNDGWNIAAMKGGGDVAHNGEYPYFCIDSEDDAMLLAAAPDLLEAWDADHAGPDFLEWIADRLDRVEGRHLGDVHSGMGYCIRLRCMAVAGRAAIRKAEGK